MDNFNSKMDKKINDFVLKNHLTPDENKFSAITDGLVNPKTYFASKYKILWILKEPYDEIEISEEGGIPCGGGWSAAGNLANYDKISENYANKTYNRIVYLIIHNLLPYLSLAYFVILSAGALPHNNHIKLPVLFYGLYLYNII